MSQPEPTPELKTYHGNCHCGAFKFTAKLPELTAVDICNCSFCFKTGYRWVSPGPGDFIVTKGEGTLKEYRFGAKKISFQFCPTCGTEILGKEDGSPPGINANALHDPGVDLYSLKVNEFDGKNIDPQYDPPKFAGTEPAAEIPNAKTYYGGCHCGAVTTAMKIEGPLTDDTPKDRWIADCDCSICTKDGTILTYPLKTALSIHPSSPAALTTYIFGLKFNEHKFCSNCGVSVYIHKNEHVPEDVWNKRAKNTTQEKWRETQPVNLRCFEGVEWEELREKGLIRRGDWSKMEPLYVVPE